MSLPMVAADALDAPLPEVGIEPAQKGSRSWRSPTELTFRPAPGALDWGQNVTVTVRQATPLAGEELALRGPWRRSLTVSYLQVAGHRRADAVPPDSRTLAHGARHGPAHPPASRPSLASEPSLAVLRPHPPVPAAAKRLTPRPASRQRHLSRPGEFTTQADSATEQAFGGTDLPSRFRRPCLAASLPPF